MEVSSVHMSSTDRVPQNWELLTTLSVLATSSVFAVRSYTTRVVVPHLLRFSSPQRLNNTTTRRLLRPSSLLRVCTLDNKFHVVRTQDLPSVTSYQSVKFLKVLSSATLKRTWATVEEWLVPLAHMFSLFLTIPNQTRLVSSSHLDRRNWSARPLVLWSVSSLVAVVLINHSLKLVTHITNITFVETSGLTSVVSPWTPSNTHSVVVTTNTLVHQPLVEGD